MGRCSILFCANTARQNALHLLGTQPNHVINLSKFKRLSPRAIMLVRLLTWLFSSILMHTSCRSLFHGWHHWIVASLGWLVFDWHRLVKTWRPCANLWEWLRVSSQLLMSVVCRHLTVNVLKLISIKVNCYLPHEVRIVKLAVRKFGENKLFWLYTSHFSKQHGELAANCEN